MPASLDHIHPDTPMGANLIADGATFRVWAPNARAVHVIGDFNDRGANDAEPAHTRRPRPLARLHPRRRRIAIATCSMSSAKAARDRSAIPTRASWRRRSRATASSAAPIFPGTRPASSRRRFHDFVIYQLHVGTFFTPNLPRKGGTFLDVARKIPHLAELGRDRPPAPADPGVPDQFQPRLQRHRLLLAGDGFRGRGRRPPALRRRRSTACSMPRAGAATRSRTCAAR